MSLKDYYKQNITFGSSIPECSAEILASQVNITCSPGDHQDGSSRIHEHERNSVNFTWEMQYYVGQIVAVHIDGSFCAYSMTNGAALVRVVDMKTNKRMLIRELKKDVKDLAFAYTRPAVVLGTIDGIGTTHVFSIQRTKEDIEYETMMVVMHPMAAVHPVNNFRIIWCPYVPSLEEDSNTYDDPALTFALINREKVEVWDVSVVPKKHGVGPLYPKRMEGYMEINAHTDDIVHASFSPDGTALATVGMDGYVRFFQIYTEDDKEGHEVDNYKCVHEWKPHDGYLSCLLFLDDINNHRNEFWKFAVTGAKRNSELKVWTCNDWQCLQTIKFTASQDSQTSELLFKVALDLSGKYLVMTELNNRLLYILQFETNHLKNIATVSYVSEFLVSSPILSFCITSAAVKTYRFSQSINDIIVGADGDEGGDDGEDDAPWEEAVTVNMFTVQPKTLRECTMVFQPEKLKTLNYTLKKSGGSTIEMNGTACEKEEISEINLNELQDSVSLLIQQQQQQQQQPALNLMTPDAFNSPVQNNNLSPSGARNSLGSEANLQNVINRSLEKVSEPGMESLIDFQRPQKENFASGGSSPSREVQEILALNNPSYAAQEYFDHLSAVTSEMGTEVQNDFNQTEGLLFGGGGGGGGGGGESGEVVWPNIPIVKANEVVKEENRRLIGSTEETDGEDPTKWSKPEIQAVTFRLKTLEKLVLEQNTAIQKLQQEIKSTPNVREVFTKELNVAMTANTTQLAKLFDNYMNVQQNRDRELRESIENGVAGVVVKQLVEKLQSALVGEIKHSVTPNILASFDALTHQLEVQYSQKLNSVENIVKENISKFINNKTMSDALSTSVVNLIKPSLDKSYKDMITSTLIPSWERICNSMFQQINDTFTKGTKEYTASVEAYMDRQRRVQDKGKDLIAQMQSLSDAMKANSDKLAGTLVQEVHRQFIASFNNMQDKLSQGISEIVNEQIKQGFKNHASVLEDSVMHAVRSRAVTPAPHIIDTQVQLAHIQQLLAKGNVETAFQQALSASDLSLVVFVCEKVDPQQVFKNGACILHQHVLLSLIQQLSADLAHNTETKHSYLEEALLYLEHLHNQNEHIPVILRDLVRQLTIFISSHPTHKHVKNMKVLLLATQSLLRK